MTFEDIVRKWVCVPSRVALVGASPREDRPVSGIQAYLQSRGFAVYPVNPAYRGASLGGVPCLGGLEDLPGPVDLVVLFLSPEKQAEALHQVRRLSPTPVVWFQPGAEKPLGAENLRREGVEVVEDCILATHKRLCGKA